MAHDGKKNLRTFAFMVVTQAVSLHRWFVDLFPFQHQITLRVNP
jgi:hypothetical protein